MILPFIFTVCPKNFFGIGKGYWVMESYSRIWYTLNLCVSLSRSFKLQLIYNQILFNEYPLSPASSGRLASLDILWGFDLFVLVFFQPVFAALAQRLNLPWLNSVLYQLGHEVWAGFRFWDLIILLFLFMTGASMPFSFSKFKDGPNKGPVYRKILKRFVLLFIFGMIVQGNLLLDWL